MEEKSLAMEMLQELKAQNVRLEKAFKGMLTLCIILIVALVGSNITWLVYESQYETVGETTAYTQEAESSDNSAISQDIN